MDAPGADGAIIQGEFADEVGVIAERWVRQKMGSHAEDLQKIPCFFLRTKFLTKKNFTPNLDSPGADAAIINGEISARLAEISARGGTPKTGSHAQDIQKTPCFFSRSKFLPKKECSCITHPN